VHQRAYISPVAKLEKLEELKVEGIQLSFGGVKAIDGLRFDLTEREILAIIGPNGSAGRFTLAGMSLPPPQPIRLLSLGLLGHFKILSSIAD